MSERASGMPTVSEGTSPGAVVFNGRLPNRRRFSPGDAIRLMIGAVMALLGLLFAVYGRSTASGLETDIARQLARLPTRLLDGLLAIAQMVAVLVPVVAAGSLLVRRRFLLFAQLVVAGATALALTVAVEGLLDDGRLLQVLSELGSPRGIITGTFPSAGYVASATAIVSFAAPWMSRRWRRTAWGAVVLLVAIRLTASGVPAGDLLLAVGVGAVVGSLALLLFGSPNPEPSPEELTEALRVVGLEPQEVSRTDERGARPAYHLLETSGRRCFLKLRTPEDRDADFLNRVYRAARFRSSHLANPFASVKREIEHEVFLLGLARDAGVRGPEVVAFGVTSGESAFLVQELVDGQPASVGQPAQAGTLSDLWRQVAGLHAAGIAHRGLTAGNVLVDRAGGVWLIDFDQAEASASRRELDQDVADLLVECALGSGVGAAVDAAVGALGKGAVAAALPLLQPLALTSGVRRRLRTRKALLAELRKAVQESTGAPDAPLARLERIRPRTLLVIVGSTVAFYSLLPQLGNLDSTAEALRNANFPWLAALVLASVVTYLFATVCFLGSVAQSLPVAPTLRAQVASSFATLFGPGSTGSLALGVRFLERSGVRGTEATAAVALNAVAGTVTHVLLLLGFVLWTGKSGAGRFSLPATNTVLLVLAVLASLVGLVLLVRPLRQRIMAPAISALRSGLAQIGRVFLNPARVIALFGGSAALSLAYIAGLMAAVEAFGGDLTFPQVGTAYLAGSAIASLAPTPGGLGAVESALIAALTGYGLRDGLAVSAVLTFRLATFWLPILPGWLLFGWMQRHSEL